MIQQLSSRLKFTSEKFLAAVANGKVTEQTAQDILNSSEITLPSKI